jgi:hypothetical protein
MYAAIRIYQADSSAAEEIARRAQESLVPQLKAIPGFRVYALVHAGGDRYVSVSSFEDRAGAEESSRLGPAWVRENVAQYLHGAPEIIEGDVIVRAGA